MMMFIEKSLAEIKNKPQQFFIGSCIFFIPVMGTSVRHVASTCFALLLLYSFCIIKDWKSVWQQLSSAERWLLKGFSLYAILGLVAYINVENTHDYIKLLERYMRFLLAIPIYLLIKKYNVSIVKYFYAGIVVSGPFLLAVTMVSYFDDPKLPAQGGYHHIIFGTVAILNVGIMLAILLTNELDKIKKTIVVISMLCAFIAAVLSQSRGVWMVVPVYGLITLYYSVKYSKLKLSSVLIVFVLIAGIIVFSTVGEMIKSRTDKAINEVAEFYEEDKYLSSLGTRLAMWNVAVELWQQHPVIGAGPGDFEYTIIALQKSGRYRGMDVHNSIHSIYFQALADTGSVGLFIFLFSIFFIPLKLLLKSIARHQTMALSGIILLLVYATVGLSASWTLRLSTVSIYIIYMLALVSGIYASSDDKSEN
jgi:O-antigen ligase